MPQPKCLLQFSSHSNQDILVTLALKVILAHKGLEVTNDLVLEGSYWFDFSSGVAVCKEGFESENSPPPWCFVVLLPTKRKRWNSGYGLLVSWREKLFFFWSRKKRRWQQIAPFRKCIFTTSWCHVVILLSKGVFLVPPLVSLPSYCEDSFFGVQRPHRVFASLHVAGAGGGEGEWGWKNPDHQPLSTFELMIFPNFPRWDTLVSWVMSICNCPWLTDS